MLIDKAILSNLAAQSSKTMMNTSNYLLFSTPSITKFYHLCSLNKGFNFMSYKTEKLSHASHKPSFNIQQSIINPTLIWAAVLTKIKDATIIT